MKNSRKTNFIEKARVGSVIKINWASLAVADSTIYELL
jgi:hypothetical protein